MSNTVKIGKSEVTSTPLGLGTNAVGGYNLFPNLNDDDGLNIVKTGIENGITLLDTAYVYGLGHSEELVGQAIKDFDRHKLVIATKGAQDMSTGEEVVRNDPKFITQQVENSLKRLGTDYIDIYYLHFPDKDTPKAEAVGAWSACVNKARFAPLGSQTSVWIRSKKPTLTATLTWLKISSVWFTKTWVPKRCHT